MSLSRPLAALAALLLSAGPALAQWDPDFDPPLAVDFNSDPDIVEVNLTAAPVVWQFVPGVDTNALAYNGTIPGPMIEAKVGDLLRVHFTNNLGEPTTIHWHGVDTPADMDGSHISQLAVPDGGTFTYEFTLLTPGLKWYHPHVRTDYMVEHGLYGALLVRQPAFDAALGIQGHEHVIMWDDIAMDVNTGAIDTFEPTDPLERAIYFLSGRRGNVLLLNGRESTSMSLDVPNGEPQRWWIVNVSNASFTRLDLYQFYVNVPAEFGDPASGSMSGKWIGETWQIGGDRGLIEARRKRPAIQEVIPVGGADHPTDFDEKVGILLVPGERMEINFTPFGDDGETIRVDQWDWPRGDHIAFYMPDGVTIGLGDEPNDGYDTTNEYFTMTMVGPDPGPPYYQPPINLVPVNKLDLADVDKTVTAVIGHAPPMPTGDVTMFVQMFPMGVPKPFMAMTSVEAYDFEVGDLVQWNIVNKSHGDHPFHTHGFPFQIVDTTIVDNDDPANNAVQTYRPEFKDTFLAPQRPGAFGTSETVTRALMLIDDTGREGQVAAQGRQPSANTSGGWLFHCHILEHAKRGMMSFFEVRYPDDPFANLGGGMAGPSGEHSYLSGTGTVQAGNQLSIDLTGATPSIPTVLVLGVSEVNLPYQTGVLVPSPDLQLVLVTDSNGEISFPWNWDSWPVGVKFYLQYWHIEALGPLVVSASNTLRIEQL